MNFNLSKLVDYCVANTCHCFSEVSTLYTMYVTHSFALKCKTLHK